MSVLTSLGLIAYFAFSSNALNPNGLVRVTRQLTIVLFGDVLPYLLFLAGSLIAIRVFGETSPHRPWFCRILQTLVVLVLISVTVSAGISYGQLVGERLRSSLAVVLGTAYSYRLTLDGTGLVFDGNVTYGVADHLNQELRRHPTIRRITLNSGGGLTDEATAAAALIEEAQLDTVVDNSCESACVLMFLAGKQRTLSPLGKLGFHRPVALNPRARMGAISSCGEYARYGVSKEFCEKVDTYSPPAIWYPTPEELAAAHIISASTPGKRFQNLPF